MTLHIQMGSSRDIIGTFTTHVGIKAQARLATHSLLRAFRVHIDKSCKLAAFNETLACYHAAHVLGSQKHLFKYEPCREKTCFLHMRKLASSQHLWLYSQICIGPGQQSRIQVFSRCGSYYSCVSVFISDKPTPCRVKIGWRHTMFMFLHSSCIFKDKSVAAAIQSST